MTCITASTFSPSVFPLRERRGCIPTLIDYFIKRLNREYSKNFSGITHAAMQALEGYTWPGNVRELRNTIERAMMLSSGPEIDMKHLPEEVTNPRQKYANSQNPGVISKDGSHRLQIQLPPEGVTMEGVERELIIMALQQHGYNQTRAAKTLGMSRDTLRYRMKKFEIKEEGS